MPASRPRDRRPLPRGLLTVALIGALIATAAPAVVAQDASPAPQATSTPAPGEARAWPTPDELRRELQEIGFAFRIDRASGDWLGWAPRATPLDAHSITLASDGAAPAWARATFETLETDLLGGDIDGPLTALLEVASRTPLPPETVSRAFRFIVDDLLVEVPVLQAECYATTTPAGRIVIRLDTETGSASVLLADRASDHPDTDELDGCSAIGPRVVERESTEGSSSARSERVTIVATADGLEPSEVELEGPLVTVVLTFRNDDTVARELVFDPPVAAATGPVEPGGSALIIVRRLGVGAQPFRLDGAGGVAGRIRVTDPFLEDEEAAGS